MNGPAPTIWPHDDIDAFEAAAWSATWRWMRTIEPFQPVRFGFVGGRYVTIGRELTRHVDADELARRAAGQRPVRSLEAIMADYWRIADEGRRDAMIVAGAVPDELASGW